MIKTNETSYIKTPVQTTREFQYDFNYENLYIIMNSIFRQNKKEIKI